MIQGRALTKLMGSFIFSEDLVRIDIFDPTGQAILSLQSDRDWLHWWDLQIGQWYSCPVQGPSVTSFPPILSGPVLLGRCRADEMPQTNAADVTLAKRMITLMWTPKRDCCPDLVRWQIDPSGRIVQRAWLCGEGAQFDISFNYDNRRSRWPRQIILSQWGRPGLKLDITELIERDAPPAKTVRLPVPESPVIITWDDFWASLTTEEPNKWTSSDQ